MEEPISPLIQCQPHESSTNDTTLNTTLSTQTDEHETVQYNCDIGVQAMNNDEQRSTRHCLSEITNITRTEAATTFLNQIVSPMSSVNDASYSTTKDKRQAIEVNVKAARSSIMDKETMPITSNGVEGKITSALPLPMPSANNLSDRQRLSLHASMQEEASTDKQCDAIVPTTSSGSTKSTRRNYSSRDLAAVDFLSSISVHDQKQVSTAGNPQTLVESPPRRALQLYSSTVLRNDNGIDENGIRTCDHDVNQVILDNIAMSLAQSGAQNVSSQELLEPSHESLSLELNEDLAATKAALYNKRMERERLLLGQGDSSVEPSVDQRNQDERSVEEKGDQLRFVFATSKGTPLTISSVIRMTDTRARARSKGKVEPMDRLRRLDALKKQRAESFQQLIVPSGSLRSDSAVMLDTGYDPRYLDDPELRTGKRRTVISLPSMMSSTVQFVKPSDLKRELNEQFRQTHPYLDEKMTLSKIRSLKTCLLSIATEQDLELATVALCYAYFEKLVLSRVVTKSNRRLVAGICMLLAVKINEIKEHRVPTVYAAIARHMEVTVKQLREQEFSIYAALGFNLCIAPHEFMPHFERIFAQLSKLHYVLIEHSMSTNQHYVNDRLS
ncbi:hypothetical protein BDF22DRAFT_698147 [Syncephalis plumigaleata]|nr:hypothetical protein BDF22DRAFT_698147 [Syncephalis plumigaleata]